ncbi:hypothetical protein Y032_0163g3507 [Ancylostoma ceylanicum]|uniref:C-type lectin domain-containing protein n=1 Tax=Ancylostoma ceylanicum TaxID=53326 RepID=A0A016SWU0_9BILA|nr:hypothetical protein Y032_0163g3507 [Ancylostoma ceylanicum]
MEKMWLHGGDGSFARKRYVEGSFGKETIRLGELVMPKTWFGQAERMDPSFAHTHFDGVLGLGGKPGAPLRRAVELGLLDQPIYTVFLKRIRNDSDPRCDSDWTYFDLTNSCYYVGSENNFDSAEADCISLGAHLTSIHNGFENNFVSCNGSQVKCMCELDLLSALTEVGQKQNTNEMTWIGLRYQQNKWTWTDGSDTAYMNWMKGRPEKDASKYPCVQILQDDYKGAKTQWNDVNCGIRMRKYVCKKPASNNAL